jgi:hypothetical protein
MTSAPPAPNRPRRIAGIVVGIVFALASLGVAFAIYTTFFTYRDPSGPIVTACVASGAHCDQGLLNTICYIGYALCLFGWAIPVGFMLVRFVQKRRAWYLPLLPIPIVLIGFYVLVFILGRSYGV